MSDPFQPYSDPETLSLIRDVSLVVIREVAPEEELSAKKLTGPIAQAYEEGDLIVAGTDSKTFGGFGDVDLITLVTVATTIATISALLQQFSISAHELREKLREEENEGGKGTKRIYECVEQQYKLVSRQVKSNKARPKEKKIKEAIKRHIRKVFDLER